MTGAGMSEGGGRPLPLWRWLPAPLLLAAILVLRLAGSNEPHESMALAIALNVVFSTAASLLVAHLAARSFLVNGSPDLLLFACGALAWSGAGTLAMTAGGSDPNAQVSIHNLCVWLAASCHLGGVLLARRSRGAVRAPQTALPLALAGTLAAMGLFVLLGRQGALPTFFVPGQGGTSLRLAVLGSATAMFALAAAALLSRRAVRPSLFVQWYGVALALVAIGLFGVLLERNVASAVGWTGRAAQLLSGIYMVMAAVRSMRDTSVLALSLKDSLRASEERFRLLASELQTVLDLAPVAIWIAHDPESKKITGNAYADQVIMGVERGANISRSAAPGEAAVQYRNFRDGVEVPVDQLPAQLAASSGQPVPPQPMELRFTGGRRVHLMIGAAPLLDAEHRVRGTVTAGADITRLKQTEEALRATEAEQRREREFLQTLLDHAQACVAVMQGKELRYTMVNAAYQALRPEVAMVGHTHREVFPEAAAAGTEALLRKVLETGEPASGSSYSAPIPGKADAAWDHQIVRLPREEGVAPSILVITFDVTDRARAESAVKTANEQLREADRRKNEFLAVLSHELRNPLTPIRNSLYILERSAPGGEQARRAHAVIDRQVTHLTRLVDDLLDVTRITRGKIRLQRSRVDLAGLVRRTVDDHRSLLEEHQVVVRLPDEPIWVDADPTRVSQAIGNLLSNAAKFTPEDERISVSLAKVQGRAVLDVEDSGVGIDAETLKRLFEPFAQADRSLDRSRGGLGLGLALVKGMVELHGGDVAAHSDGPGRGARITVRLPVCVEEPAATARPEPSLASLGRHVLIIEDNRDAAQSLADALALSGHDMAIAYDGESGVAKAREVRPEIVLCDIGLPGMDGYAVASALRQEVVTASAYLVALTGYAQPEDERRALQAGFDAHVSKPPDMQALEAVLRRARPYEGVKG